MKKILRLSALGISQRWPCHLAMVEPLSSRCIPCKNLAPKRYTEAFKMSRQGLENSTQRSWSVTLRSWKCHAKSEMPRMQRCLNWCDATSVTPFMKPTGKPVILYKMYHQFTTVHCTMLRSLDLYATHFSENTPGTSVIIRPLMWPNTTISTKQR